MTPDEVVSKLEDDLIKYNFTVEDVEFQKIIVSYLQDYQKLRWRIDVEKIEEIMIKTKKISAISHTGLQAQAIVAYLDISNPKPIAKRSAK